LVLAGGAGARAPWKHTIQSLRYNIILLRQQEGRSKDLSGLVIAETGDAAVDFESGLVNTTLRVVVLPPSRPAFDALVQRVDGKRVTVACKDALPVGAAIKLDAPDRMLLAEVLAVERTPVGVLAQLEVQYSLVHADVQRIRSNFGALGAPDVKADAVGV
jgi:hypothetical protein